MSSTSFLAEQQIARAAAAAAGGPLQEYRARLELEQIEATERRERYLAEQSSTVNDPEARIRAWERAHGLTLPRSASHPVLGVVAAATRLTLEQVQAEQQRRTKPRAPIAAIEIPGAES